MESISEEEWQIDGLQSYRSVVTSFEISKSIESTRSEVVKDCIGLVTFKERYLQVV